ncbi:hypothetical protein GLYMA_18G087100v4 [Glycine max]|uniref:Uncharacterized protein n=2 Tax=Glycine subgen. Soja TaxID=1462606 RepID=A0A0R0F6E4_SOYBN|nr:hypothetical protein GLYMA_18G087100v4 [Glycine max]RZB51268.1 hypothetical protein D0Y65_047901 [Glycine soja]
MIVMVRKADKTSWKRKRTEENDGRRLGVTSPPNPIDGRPYVREDENYLRELETRQQTRHYGIQNPNSVMSNYLSVHDPANSHHMGPSYPALALASEPYVMNTPAMQRYAPRLDELNHARMDPLGSEPAIVGRNGAFERSALPPGYGSRMPGFAAGSHHMYSRQNSSDRFNG